MSEGRRFAVEMAREDHREEIGPTSDRYWALLSREIDGDITAEERAELDDLRWRRGQAHLRLIHRLQELGR